MCIQTPIHSQSPWMNSMKTIPYKYLLNALFFPLCKNVGCDRMAEWYLVHQWAIIFKVRYVRKATLCIFQRMSTLEQGCFHNCDSNIYKKKKKMFFFIIWLWSVLWLQQHCHAAFLFISGQIITASVANIMISGSVFSPMHSLRGETKTPQRCDHYDLYLGKMWHQTLETEAK